MSVARRRSASDAGARRIPAPTYASVEYKAAAVNLGQPAAPGTGPVSGQPQQLAQPVFVLLRADVGQVEPLRREDAAGHAQHVVGRHRFDAGEHLVGRKHLVGEQLLRRVPLGHAGAVLQAQLGAALDVLLHLAQFRFRYGILAQLVDFRQDRAQGSLDLLRLDAGVDRHGPRIVEGADVGVDVVGESAPLAHLQEEPRAHAVAQDGVGQPQRVAVGVGAAQRPAAQAEIRLLRLARLLADARLLARFYRG